MKTIIKIFILVFLALALFSCGERAPFNGRVVYKEYIKGHMCHSDAPVVSEAGMFPAYVHVHHTHHHTHHHRWQDSEFIVYAANKNDLISRHVDSLTWSNIVCGQKIKFK